MLVGLLGCAEPVREYGGYIDAGPMEAGITVNVPPDQDEVTTRCDCLPSCSLDQAEVEDGLCRSAGALLVLRSTFAGCSDVRFSRSADHYSTFVLVKNGTMSGCGFASVGETSLIADMELSASCDTSRESACSPCLTQDTTPHLARRAVACD